MNAQINSDVVGREFDKWLDWNGTVDESSLQLATSTNNGDGDAKDPSHRSVFAVSPTSTTHSSSPLAMNSTTHTAPSTTGPLTPSHSSGSPEINSASIFRLSGDTLREDDSTYRHLHLKRKLSSETPNPQERPAPAKPGASKRPHNVIEKRYRANLNEKIAELRDSVPVLRAVQKARDKEDGDASSGEDNIESFGSNGKLNKASILTKAVEYIRHLEFRTKRLEDENRALKERLHILDRVIAQGGSDAQRATAFTSENVIENSASAKSSSAAASPSSATPAPSDQQRPVQGLVPAPESWKTLRQNQQQEHYGHVYNNPGERSRLGGKWPSRLMLGSLAGLMVMEGFAEPDHGTDSREKGLFGIPLELLDGWTFLWSPRLYMRMFAEYCRAGGILPLIKGFMALSIFAFFIFAYLFNSKPHPEKDQEKNILEEPKAASPASPIEVRRRAWSTSMQALRLPHHSFFPEWLALTSEWMKYTIQYCLGHHTYARLTGRSLEDEIARIKAWDIALDAQLAGGDTEISRSRVLLTIYGSGTLPQSPMRLMQKALHCRVLLWNVGLPGTTVARLTNYMAAYFANRQWRHARRLHERLSARDNDRLPGYLNYLLQMDCDDVFNDTVTQRATNLMYDRPTSERAEDMLMDVVVEDHAIRSPLDAVAAWRSTSALCDALDAALQCPDSADILREHIQAALEIAPPGSAAETRALAVHAVLSPGRRRAFYERAIEAMATVSSQDATVPYFIDSSTPFSARPEIASCLHGAKVMLTLDQDRNLQHAVNLLTLSPQISNPSALSVAPLFFVLWRIWRASGSGVGPTECSKAASQVLNFLRDDTFKAGQPHGRIASAMEFLRCAWELTSASPSRRYSVVSNDTGYVSLSEEDYEQRASGALPAGHDATNSVVTEKEGSWTI